jgi:hypothetical protein
MMQTDPTTAAWPVTDREPEDVARIALEALVRLYSHEDRHGHDPRLRRWLALLMYGPADRCGVERQSSVTVPRGELDPEQSDCALAILGAITRLTQRGTAESSLSLDVLRAEIGPLLWTHWRAMKPCWQRSGTSTIVRTI